MDEKKNQLLEPYCEPLNLRHKCTIHLQHYRVNKPASTFQENMLYFVKSIQCVIHACNINETTAACFQISEIIILNYKAFLCILCMQRYIITCI